MKIRINELFFYLSTFVGVSLSSISHAQWQQLPSPSGGNITTLARNGNIVYAATTGGIYKSVNNGAFWNHLSINALPFKEKKCQKILVLNSKVFMLSPVTGFVVSSDSGKTWQKINSPQDSVNEKPVKVEMSDIETLNGSIYLLSSHTFIAPGNVSWHHYRIFKSADNGLSWVKTDTLDEQFTGPIRRFYHAGDTLFIGGSSILYLDSFDKLKPFNSSGLNSNEVQDIRSSGGSLFVRASTTVSSVSQTDIYKYNGLLWNIVSDGINSTDKIMRFFAINSDLYCTTYKRDGLYQIYYSEDEGNNWMQKDAAGLPNPLINEMLLNYGNGILVGASTGIFTSSDNANHFTDQNTGIAVTSQNNILLSGTSLIAPVLNGNVILSTDKGNTWSTLNNLNVTYRGDMVFKLRNTVYFNHVTLELDSSSDNGATWTKIKLPDDLLTFNSFKMMGTNEGSTLFIYGDTVNGSNTGKKYYRSIDGGSNWADYSSKVPKFGDISEQTFMKGNGPHLLFLRADSLIKSDNNGDTWSDYKKGFASNSQLKGLYLCENDFYAIKTNGNKDSLYKREGDNWVKLGQLPFNLRNLYSYQKVLYIVNDPGNPPVDLTLKGISTSTDGGATWQSFNTGFDSIPPDVTGLAFIGDEVFASTNNTGIWKNAILTNNSVSEIPDPVFKVAAFPNPTHSKFLIEWGMPTSQKAILQIWDSQGKLHIIKEIENQNFEEIDMSAQPSGMYLYHVTIEDGKAAGGKLIKE